MYVESHSHPAQLSRNSLPPMKAILSALAAAILVDSETTLVVSTGVILEVLHVLRTQYRYENPLLGDLLVRFLTRSNVEVADADRRGVVSAIASTRGVSARRIPDVLHAEAAAHARCDALVTFDQGMRPGVIPVQLL